MPKKTHLDQEHNSGTFPQEELELKTINNESIKGNGDISVGVWETITTTDISVSVNQVDIEHDFSSDDYSHYKLVCTGLGVSVAGWLELLLKLGGSYATANYNFSRYTYSFGNTPAAGGSSSASSISLLYFNGADNNSNIDISVPKNSKQGIGVSFKYDALRADAGEVSLTSGVCSNTGIGLFEGLRLKFPAGTIDNGKIQLLGLKA